MRKKAILAYIDYDVYLKLKEIARERSASVSQVIREIIMKEIKNSGCKNGKA